MKLDAEDRLASGLESESRWPWFAAVAVVAACLAGAVAAYPPARDYVKGLLFGVEQPVTLRQPVQPAANDRYSAVYQRLGMAPLPANLLASSQISSGLTQLAREPCDKTAIFAFGEALASAKELRRAADAYAGFAATCPNGDGEQYRAADLLFLLGDTGKVIATLDPLITRNPAIGAYRYLRGRALADAKRYPEAVEDYKSTIELQKNPRDIGEWVFLELANIYAAMGRPCEAMTVILAWIAIDPSVRNTPTARKKAEAYSPTGCAQRQPPTDLKKL